MNKTHLDLSKGNTLTQLHSYRNESYPKKSPATLHMPGTGTSTPEQGRISWTIQWHTAGFHCPIGRIFYQNVKKILPPVLLGRIFAFLYTMFSQWSSKGGVPDSIDLSGVEHYQSHAENTTLLTLLEFRQKCLSTLHDLRKAG